MDINDVCNYTAVEISSHAIITNSAELIKKGLSCTFYYESNVQNDYRDVITELTLYYNALLKLGEEPNKFIHKFSKELEKNEFKEIIKEFIGRNDEDKTLESAGYIEVLEPQFHYKFKYS